MAFTEFEAAQVEVKVKAYLDEKRPPVDLRNQVDLGFRMEDRAVEIFEIRPSLRDSSEKVEEPVARAVYVKRAGEWRVYWQRADQKWHLYEPTSRVSSIDEFLALIEEDKHGCFWG